MRKQWWLTLFGLLLADPAWADVITLTPAADTIVVGGSFHAQTPSQYAYLGANLVGNIGDVNDTIAPSQGLLSFSLPSGVKAVNKATLQLFEDGNGGTTTGTFAFYRNTSGWQPTTVTWDSRPGQSISAVATLNIGDGKDYVWRSWDVTSVVDGWLSGSCPNYGLTFSKEGSVYPVIFFGSGQLVIGPNTPPPPPSGFSSSPSPRSSSAYFGPELILQTASSVAAAPEPSTFALTVIAIVGVITYSRQRRARLVSY
jgi:hypothetical protein